MARLINMNSYGVMWYISFICPGLNTFTRYLLTILPTMLSFCLSKAATSFETQKYFGVQNLQFQRQKLIFVPVYLTTLVGLQLRSRCTIVLQEEVTQAAPNIWMSLCSKKLSQLAC